MDIFLAEGSEKTGPHTRYQIREKLVEGEITGDTLGWTQGEDSWKPIREIEPVLWIIQTIEREKLDEELSKTPRPSVRPEPTIPYNRLSSHAFARYAARFFDLTFIYVLALAIWPLGPRPTPEFDVGKGEFPSFKQIFEHAQSEESQEFEEKRLTVWLCSVFAGHLLEILLLSTWGTTLGKLLFRVQVVDHEGARLKFGSAAARSMLAYLMGMGLGYPIFQILANFLSFRRLGRTGMTFWDEMLHTQVRQLPMSGLRTVLAVFLFIVVMLLSVILTQ